MDPERVALIASAKDWGYWKGAIKTRYDLWQGKRLLDVGMGGGPHCVSFVENGAQCYVGVDPLVGTDHVRDFRNNADKSLPAYHAFPFSPADMMRIYPNAHLYPTILEKVPAEIRQHKCDIAIMDAVSEHLTQLEEVVRTIWELLEPHGLLWLCHCNYYSWTGHHREPRFVKDWRQDDPDHAKVVEWRHLEPDHADYSNSNFNRVRLEDLRLLIAKYFEIVEWRVSVDALARLTPEIRARWKKYTLEELLGRNIYITGRRRDRPLDVDLSSRQFHHPAQDYQAERDFSGEDIEPFALINSAYFSKTRELFSHGDNDNAAHRVFTRLKPGDTVTVRKFTHRLN